MAILFEPGTGEIVTDSSFPSREIGPVDFSVLKNPGVDNGGSKKPNMFDRFTEFILPIIFPHLETQRLERDNYKLQKDLFDYNKKLQERIFEREDTAVQRKVEDTRAAGLSPVLTSGSSARSGGIVGQKAPQKGLAAVAQKTQLYQMVADVSKTVAEVAYINAQKDKTRVETENAVELHPHKLSEAMDKANITSKTMQDVIDMSTHASKRATHEATMAEDKVIYNKIDLHWKQALETQLLDKASEGGVVLNPEQLEYATTLLAKRLLEHDVPIYENMPVPSGTLNSIIGGITSLSGGL